MWGVLREAELQRDVTQGLAGEDCNSGEVTAAAAQMAGEEAYDLKNAEAEVQTAAGSAAELRVASALRCAGIVLPETQPPRPTPAVAERAALVAAERCFRAVASLSPTSVAAQQHLVGFAVAQWRAAVSNAGGATTGGDVAVGEGSAEGQP